MRTAYELATVARAHRVLTVHASASRSTHATRAAPTHALLPHYTPSIVIILVIVLLLLIVARRPMRRPVQFVVAIGVRDLRAIQQHEHLVGNLVARKLHKPIA